MVGWILRCGTQIQRVNCKVIFRLSTVWRVGAPNAIMFKGQLYIVFYNYPITHYFWCWFLPVITLEIWCHFPSDWWTSFRIACNGGGLAKNSISFCLLFSGSLASMIFLNKFPATWLDLTSVLYYWKYRRLAGTHPKARKPQMYNSYTL